LTVKRNNPRESFGSKDSPFNSEGIYGQEIPGLMHAHLNQDLSIVYKVVGRELYLNGIYSHESLGTGNPSNRRVQQSMAQRFKKMKYTEE